MYHIFTISEYNAVSNNQSSSNKDQLFQSKSNNLFIKYYMHL